MAAPPPPDSVLLRDGSTAVIRPYAASDLMQLEEMAAHLSAETVRLRYHSAGQRASAGTLLGAAGARRFVAVAEHRIIGAACYIPLPLPGVAELAVVVDDADHGHGVGMRLVERLAESARAEGLQRLLALVLTENRAMLHVLTDLGFGIHRTVTGSEIEVMVELSKGDAYLGARRERERVARLASVSRDLPARLRAGEKPAA